MLRRSFKNPFQFLCSLAIVGCIALGLSGCWLLPERALKEVFKLTTDSPPSSVLFLPQQTPAAIVLQVDPEHLEPPALLSSIASKIPLSQALQAIKQGVVENVGLKYDLDVQPWLGSEITLALTDVDIDHNPENGLHPGYLVACSIQDGNGAREFLQRFWQTRAVGGQSIATERYKGATLVYDRSPQSEQSLASAAIGEYFLLFANDVRVLKNAITTAQLPDQSLAFTGAYNRGMENLGQLRLGLGLLNLSSLWLDLQEQPLAQTIVQGMGGLPPAELLLSLSPTRYGIQAEAALAGFQPTEPQSETFETIVDPALPILRLLPPDTLMMVAGQEIEQLWEEVRRLKAQVPWVAAIVDPWLRPLTQVDPSGSSLFDLGLNGFQGNYVLGLIPGQSASERQWIVAVDRTAPGAAETLSALDQQAQNRHYGVNQLSFRERSVTTWSQLQADEVTDSSLNAEQVTLKADLAGVHSTLDRYEVFTPSLDTLARVLDAWDQGSLLETDSFETVISPLASGGYNYLYLNWPHSQTWLENRFPALNILEFLGYSIFSNLDSIVLRSNPSAQDERGYRVETATLALNLSGSSRRVNP